MSILLSNTCRASILSFSALKLKNCAFASASFLISFARRSGGGAQRLFRILRTASLGAHAEALRQHGRGERLRVDAVQLAQALHRSCFHLAHRPFEVFTHYLDSQLEKTIKSLHSALSCRLPLIQTFTAYTTWLDLDLAFQSYAAELAALPGTYVPPSGALLLALDTDSSTPLSIIALRPSTYHNPTGDGSASNHRCELKRLYTVPEARGRGVARALRLDIEGCNPEGAACL
ncbi:hypothetical protein B0H14DRAFT_2539641 [Mycena olivaceomarginata]|nr:hypothetical protein B0H14DRAFT_2539641 [Mycena olivaceomarginata]